MTAASCMDCDSSALSRLLHQSSWVAARGSDVLHFISLECLANLGVEGAGDRVLRLLACSLLVAAGRGGTALIPTCIVKSWLMHTHTCCLSLSTSLQLDKGIGTNSGPQGPSGPPRIIRHDTQLLNSSPVFTSSLFRTLSYIQHRHDTMQSALHLNSI